MREKRLFNIKVGIVSTCIQIQVLVNNSLIIIYLASVMFNCLTIDVKKYIEWLIKVCINNLLFDGLVQYL